MPDTPFAPLSPKVILGIAAHPDDLDVTAGGTLAHFAKQGAEIHYLILTDGSKGSDDPTMTTEQLIQTRQAEQKAALELIGGSSITFLGYPDGELEITLELKKRIVQTIRTVKPDVVITMDPTVVYSAARGIINHPDHRAAGQAALDALFPLARDRLAFPELYEQHKPHKVTTVLMANFNESTFTVDISDSIDTKIRMIQAHPSQFGTQEPGWLRDMARAQGEPAGFDFGEGFVRVDVR